MESKALGKFANNIVASRFFVRSPSRIRRIAEQNSSIKTNNIKAKIDNEQQSSKCRLCGDRDETIDQMTRECGKLAQKVCKSRHDWRGKVIHWKLCKKSKFHHTTKW